MYVCVYEILSQVRIINIIYVSTFHPKKSMTKFLNPFLTFQNFLSIIWNL